MTPEDVVRRAMIRKMCVLASYNRSEIRLAPHILYTRHDDLFVDGQVMERDGRPPREIKIGTFKLAGLSEVRPSTAPFEPLPSFDPEASSYQGVTMQAVQR